MYRSEMLYRLAIGEDPLELSIQKWQDIVDCLDRITDMSEFDQKLQNGSLNCALCERCNLDELFCDQCIIGIYTDQWDCRGTPFNDARMSLGSSDIERARIACRSELEFLKSLRMVKSDA